jgi:hypothetical protein
MESQCVVCHEKVATFRCIQCHKPVCGDCAFKTENGAFCGRECASNYREFARAQGRAPARRRSPLGAVMVLLVIIGLVWLAFYARSQGWVHFLGK